MLVVDASLVVAALVDGGPTGTWAEDLLAAGDLAAPHLMFVEAATILRHAQKNRPVPRKEAGRHIRRFRD